MKKTTLALAITLASIAGYSNANSFINDSKATLGLRNFFYDRNDKNTTNSNNETREWGQGFLFNYQSGFTAGTVGFGLDAIALVGIKLDSGGDDSTPRSRAPGALFPKERDGSAVDNYGKAGVTAKVRISKTELRIGTLQPKLPVINFNDGRLLPQTFEGGQITSAEIDSLTLTFGQLESTKTRSSTDDIALRISGADSFLGKPADSNKFIFAGGDYKITKALTAQYYYGSLEDFYTQHFLGLTHNLVLPAGALKTDLRYFNSGADGRNNSDAGRSEGYRSSGYWKAGDRHAGEVDNNTWSALFTYSLSGHAISAGYQQVSGGSAFPFVSQGDGATAYLITDRQIGKFASAGERTWLAEYGYDFASAGIPGLKATATYLSGSNINAIASDRKEWERDVRLDYTLQNGALKGLGFSWRNASFRSNAATDLDENRFIVSYSLPLL